MVIGFSTGELYKTHERVSRETCDAIRSLGCETLEFACGREGDLEKLIETIKPQDLEGFKYISLHAPAITDVKVLELVKKAHDIFNFKLIVIHPDEVANWDMFSNFDLPFAVENMDWRKQIGKYTESMQDIFSKFDAPMVLDLNHCYTNDPSMRLAHEMIDNFRDRIKEIHLSGFETHHEPLYKTEQHEILEAIFDKEIPIIIESGCETMEDAQKELEYIKAYISGKTPQKEA